MIRVLFVCHGNICRSPMAEFIFKDMVSKQGLSDRFYIASAATSTEEIWNGIGNPVYPPAREELAKHGIDCKGKRAVQLTKADYDKYDYILGMDYWNLKNMLRILKSDPEDKVKLLLDYSDDPRDIADPWYTGGFDVTYSDVVEGCEAFLEYLKDKVERIIAGPNFNRNERILVRRMYRIGAYKNVDPKNIHQAALNSGMADVTARRALEKVRKELEKQ